MQVIHTALFGADPTMRAIPADARAETERRARRFMIEVAAYRG